MAVAYGIAGLGKWVEDDGGVLNKAVLDSDNPDFQGIGGFETHGINGMMIIPLLALVLLVVSFFTKLPGATKRAAILLGLIVLQVILGIALHGVPYIAWLHVLNAFIIFVGAFQVGRWATATEAAPAQPVAAA
jgi:hypothetical protein